MSADDQEKESEVDRAGNLGGVHRSIGKSLSGGWALLDRLSRGIAARPRKTLNMLSAATVMLALVAASLIYLVEGHNADLEARSTALKVAQDRAISLLSYDYRTIDRQVADNEDGLTGKFKDDYSALVKSVISQAAKDQQVTTQTQVVAQSVVSGNTKQVIVLLFLNQQTESKNEAAPVLTGSRLRVTLDHNDDKWQISDLTPV